MTDGTQAYERHRVCKKYKDACPTNKDVDSFSIRYRTAVISAI
jgi:hypothetical protein